MNTTPASLHLARADQAHQSNLRTVAIIDLANLAGSDAFEGSLDGPLEDLVDDLQGDWRVHPSMEPLRAAAEAADDTVEFLGELLFDRRLLGFAVRFSTPVMTKVAENAWQYSWGYTQSIWVYADSYEEAWKLGLAWAAQCKAKSKSTGRGRA